MSRRSLWPREHGAYFQLVIPLLVACALRIPSPAAIALAVAAALAFLANEPLLVILGHRGARMRAVDGDRARARLVGLASGAVVLGAAGLALAPRATLAAAAIVALPTAAVLVLAWRRAEHTLAGELVAAVALTGASVPVMAASGLALGDALACWLGWSIGFAAMVVAIHRVLARHKARAGAVDWIIGAGLVIAMVACARAALLVAAIPLAMLATLVVIVAPSASRLRAIGIATAIVAAASGIALLA